MSCVPTPIPVVARVYLSLYGIGLRGTGSAAGMMATIGGVAAQVVFAGPQSQFVGLDQVNVIIPASLRGRGTLEVRVSAAGSTSNVVSIAIQ